MTKVTLNIEQDENDTLLDSGTNLVNFLWNSLYWCDIAFASHLYN